MPEIIKVYKQSIPAVRFIGKKYGDDDRIGGGFGAKWGEWFQNGWFDTLESLVDSSLKDTYEDTDAYLGFMRCKDGEPFEYWIGMFTAAGTSVPDGYDYIDIKESNIGVCWVHGEDGTVYCYEDKCAEKLKEENMEVISDDNGAWCFFERYGCPRFTTPDTENKIILDICHYVK